MKTLIARWREFRANRAAWNEAGAELDEVVDRHHRAVVAKHGRRETWRMQWRDTYPEPSGADGDRYDALQDRLAELVARMPAWQRY